MPFLSPQYPVHRAFIYLYGGVCIFLAAVLIFLTANRGLTELLFLGAGALATVAVAWLLPRHALLLAAGGAFLLGFVRTFRGESGMDAGVVFIAIALAIHLWRQVWGGKNPRLDLMGLLLFLLAGIAMVSLVFFVTKVVSFTTVPGFAYHPYAFNPRGMSSNSLFPRVFDCALIVFSWFGLYQYARTAVIEARTMRWVVTLILIVNGAVLLWQQHIDSSFLLPAGAAIDGRFSGLTSYCYALGAGLIGLILLFPAWKKTGKWALPVNIVLGVLLLYSVSASGSRNALLALLVVAIGWSAIECVRSLFAGRRRRAALVFLSLVLMVFGIGMLYVVTPEGLDSPIARLKMGIEADGIVGHIVRTRLFSYPLHFAVIGAYPLAGTGVGAYYAEVIKQYRLLTPDLAVTDEYLLGSYAPNMFLNVGVELGLPGFILFLAVFLLAFIAALRQWRLPHGLAALIALLALVMTMQFGPELYNAEALVLLWLVVGMAVRGGDLSAAPAFEGQSSGRRGTELTSLVIVVVMVLAIAGQFMTVGSLSVEQQWRQLRWHLDVGFYPDEPAGRWSRPEATFVTDSTDKQIVLHWHAGDPSVPEYIATVSFFVEGQLVETSRAASGQGRTSTLPLPETPGFKRISVKVSIPFVPDEALGNGDRRKLGIFVKRSPQ